MKTRTISAALWLVFSSSLCQAVILDFKQVQIAFTNAAEAQTNATWSEPDRITVSKQGLGWDGDGAGSRDGWIQTRPVALGLSWRPASAISVRAQIVPPPREFTMSNGEKSTGDAGDIYVRYSPDLKHWSSWQALQRGKAESVEEKKTPGRYYSGTIRVPYRERREYSRLLSDYSRMDVPWKSDEEGAVKWIVERDPYFFGKQIPFIGYAEFLYEGEFRGGQRIQSLKVEISYAIGGLHAIPRDKAVYENRDVPWRYESRRSAKVEATASPNSAAAQR